MCISLPQEWQATYVESRRLKLGIAINKPHSNVQHQLVNCLSFPLDNEISMIDFLFTAHYPHGLIYDVANSISCCPLGYLFVINTNCVFGLMSI